MARYGYARVSTSDQDLSIQVERLGASGCIVVRKEKVSAASRAGRDELDTLLSFLQAGDVLVVTKIDRLARSMGDLQDIVRAVRSVGASIQALDQPIDTGTATGKAFLDMLGVFAEFETNLRRERQIEGIARAKAEGRYKGRQPSISPDAVWHLREVEKLGAAAIARKLGIGRASVYRALSSPRSIEVG